VHFQPRLPSDLTDDVGELGIPELDSKPAVRVPHGGRRVDRRSLESRDRQDE